MLAERRDDRRGLLPLPLTDDLQSGFEHRVADRAGVAHDEPPGAAAVGIAGHIHPFQQRKLDEVRAAECDVGLASGDRKLAGGVIGEQQQKVLGNQHVLDINGLCGELR